MWIEGVNPPVEMVDWYKKVMEAGPGELPEEEARALLGAYLTQNIGLTAYVLTGYALEPDQRVALRGWMQKNFTICVAGRGWSKSFLAGHFGYLYSLTHAEHHTLIVSATFRSSRRIIEDIVRMARRKRKELPTGEFLPGGELLLETFDGKPSFKPDMYKIKFKNGSTITAVPLGDPDNLRGFRCNVLMIDEGLLIAQSTIDSVLKPFLTGEANLLQKQRIQKDEDRRIAAGEMKEEERRKFPSTSKMIILSSASYRWEELFQTYSRYLKIISPDVDGSDKPVREETDGEDPSYLVQQLSYKLAEKRMDKAILKQLRDHEIPEAVIRREYEAQFIDESGGYFSAKEMNKCTVPPGQTPSIEVVGEKGAHYILAIDPNMAGGDAADHFAMCVIKVIKRAKDERKVGLVVHQYACCGVEPKYHIAYFYYLLDKFKPVYVICDTTQGDNMDFINVCNESEYFKMRRMELNAIDGDFKGDSFEDIVKQVKKSYNPDSSVRRIVQKQYFSGAFIKAANEYLRASFDQELLWFPSHAQSVTDLMSKLCEQDVLGIHKAHPEFVLKGEGQEEMGSMWEFCTYQDNMIELAKKETALIEPTPSVTGNVSFDLPHHMTRNRKNVNRQRKDSYSALFMANWALKIWLAVNELPDEKPEETWLPVWA